MSRHLLDALGVLALIVVIVGLPALVWWAEVAR